MAITTVGDAIERRMALRSDKITLVGKRLLTGSIASGSAGVLFLTPSQFGDRLESIAASFLHFRFAKLVIEITSQVAPIVAGILDDVGSEGGAVPIPSTADDVLNYRCSTLVSSANQLKTLQWRDSDPNRWYYTNQGAASAPSDPRLSTAATLYIKATGTGATTYVATMYYTIELAGAVDFPVGN